MPRFHDDEDVKTLVDDCTTQCSSLDDDNAQSGSYNNSSLSDKSNSSEVGELLNDSNSVDFDPSA